VLHGQTGIWPATIDLAALPPPSTVAISEIRGAHGNAPGDQGDTLCYSGAAGKVDGDGAVDLFINEMLGNGSSAVDVGNLLVIDGQAIFAVFRDGFETGNVSRWSFAIGN